MLYNGSSELKEINEIAFCTSQESSQEFIEAEQSHENAEQNLPDLNPEVAGLRVSEDSDPPDGWFSAIEAIDQGGQSWDMRPR